LAHDLVADRAWIAVRGHVEPRRVRVRDVRDEGGPVQREHQRISDGLGDAVEIHVSLRQLRGDGGVDLRVRAQAEVVQRACRGVARVCGSGLHRAWHAPAEPVARAAGEHAQVPSHPAVARRARVLRGAHAQARGAHAAVRAQVVRVARCAVGYRPALRVNNGHWTRAWRGGGTRGGAACS